MVRVLFFCTRSGSLIEANRSLARQVRISIVKGGQLSDRSASTAVMAHFPQIATRAVLIQISLACVLSIHLVFLLIRMVQLLTSQGASDTLSYMYQYWVDMDGLDERLWEVWRGQAFHSSHDSWSSIANGQPTGPAIAHFRPLAFHPAVPRVRRRSHFSNRSLLCSKLCRHTIGLRHKASLQAPPRRIPCLNRRSARGCLRGLSLPFQISG
jgi:hypothetical protein